MVNQKVVYQTNKKTGVVYAYSNEPYWDSEKKQSRAKRKLIGKVEPGTGNIVPTRGKRAKSEAVNVNESTKIDVEVAMPAQVASLGKMVDFLRVYMCGTLAKRIMCIILFLAGLQIDHISQLTGLGQKSVKNLCNEITHKELKEVLKVSGGGRKSKLADIESQVVKDINEGDFHTRQQIADMVFEKYGVRVSLPVIGRLLKKMASDG